MTSPASATASVVIPAHDEANVIGATLSRMLARALPGEFEVIVVCNGCTDGTAVAARRDGVRVVEIDRPSKIAALNAGDRVATVFPRVYLDADIAIETEALRAVVAALRAGAPAAAPVPVVDTRSCSAVCRAYFAIWSRLGYATVHSLGSGVYGLSREGRARFGEFPDIIADDGFVYCTFSESERANPPGTTFTIKAPRTARSLLRRRIRIAAGNIELIARTGRAPEPPPPDWRAVTRTRPGLLPAAAVYATVNLLAKLAAPRRARAGTSGAWNQDRSTRGGPDE